MKVIATILLASLAAQSVAAEEKLTPDQIAAAKANNQAVLANSPDAAGIFSVSDDGTVVHAQSGMHCVAVMPNAKLWHLLVEESKQGKGADVGCDYGRNGPDGVWVSKLTIFATKAAKDATLDSEFAHYKREVEITYPGAIAMAPALQIGGNSRYRAQGYTITDGGSSHHDELIVGFVNGWTLEMRATYAHSGIIVKDPKDETDLKNQLFDIESPYLTFMTAFDSVEEAGRNAGPVTPPTLSSPERH